MLDMRLVTGIGRCGSHALHRIASRLVRAIEGLSPHVCFFEGKRAQARHVVAAQPRFLHVGSVPAGGSSLSAGERSGKHVDGVLFDLLNRVIFLVSLVTAQAVP